MAVMVGLRQQAGCHSSPLQEPTAVDEGIQNNINNQRARTATYTQIKGF
ncbi:hypothetical protein [Pseudomonas sp. Sample_24]|nr:hypothetical protein [Pseudomonas sp. Sample_24]